MVSLPTVMVLCGCLDVLGSVMSYAMLDEDPADPDTFEDDEAARLHLTEMSDSVAGLGQA